MADILLLGPQGAGKGTQGRLIAAEHGIPHVATGDMLRAAMDADTELGRRVKPIYDAGHLVPDDLMIALIRERLGEENAREGFVLDGFPRTMPQAEALEEMLREIGRDLDVVFEFQLDDAVGVERMLRRAAEEGRADDTPEAIDERLRLYHLETEPLIEYYRARGNLVGIHADRPVQEVFARDPAGARAGGGPVIIRKAAGEIERMARAGEVVADTLAMLGEHARPGVTTQELDELADEFIRSRGGTPTFKGYRGYPASICVSPNEMVVHGIPSMYALARGRHPVRGRRRDARRLRGGLGLHVPDRRDLRGGRAPARGLPGRARGRDRAVPRRQPAVRHLARDPGRHRGAGLLGRAQPRRPRRRPLDARGAADPELRRAGPRARSSPRG